VAARRLPDLGPHGEGYVAIQVVMFVAIWLAGGLGPAWGGALRDVGRVAGGILIAGGAVLLLRGFIDLGPNLTPFPKPRSDARLVDSGAYGLVRHPIYGGLVLGAAGWGLFEASIAALALAVLLGVFFDLKSRREEGWLVERFPEYPAYRARTRRLLPWLY
jgi:protein-S-isoprenylcysteine O-methyltransferase Ste14